MPQDKNPETMPLEDLKSLILAQEAEVTTTPAEPTAPAVQPRDNQGRFAALEEKFEAEEIEATKTPVVAEPVVEEEVVPDEIIVRGEVDNEDGSGVQVYYGRGANELEAQKDLTRKLIVAQKNATKKIREQQAAVKTEVAKTAQELENEKYVWSEKFKADPVATAREIAREETRRQQEYVRQQDLICENFVTSRPEYEGTNSNRTRMDNWLKANGYTEYTEEGLQKAFIALSADGLLTLKVEDASATTEEPVEATQRIAETTAKQPQPRSRKSSTVSSRGPAPVVAKTGTTEDELQKMPMEKLRTLVDEQFRTAAQERES